MSGLAGYASYLEVAKDAPEPDCPHRDVEIRDAEAEHVRRAVDVHVWGRCIDCGQPLQADVSLVDMDGDLEWEVDDR